MTESIEIKNLGPIKHVLIEEIKPLTVFIGESGSGKSTIMKVIALFRWIDKMMHIQSYVGDGKIIKTYNFPLDTYWKNCGIEQFLHQDTYINYTTKFDSGKSYSVITTGGRFNALQMATPIRNANDIYFSKICFISESRNMIPIWADRGATISGGNLGFYFQEVFREFINATEAVKEVEMGFLNLKFSTKKSENGQRKYTVESTSDDVFEIDFKNSSSGTHTSVPITLITQYFSRYFSFEDAFNRSILGYLANTGKLTDFKPVKNLSDLKKKIYIHIEEPEQGLYPDAQCELINDLVHKCFIDTENVIEVMFSTHSPYIINHLNLLIRAFEKEKFVNGANYDYDKLAVYLVRDGTLENLMILNKKLVDTNSLSETINNIYSKYNAL